MTFFTSTSMALGKNMAPAIPLYTLQIILIIPLTKKFNLAKFIDLKEAFDTGKFDILFNKLKY